MKTTLLAFLLFTGILYGQCPPGNVTFNTQADVDNFVATYPNCDEISGDLIITGTVDNLTALDYLQTIDGDFIIQNTQLTTISNFDSLAEVLTMIEISANANLTEIISFNALIDLGTLFIIENNPNLDTINGFNNATDVFGDLWIIHNTALETINGFDRLTSVHGFLGIRDNPSLISIPSFNNLNYIGWAIQFYNTGLTDISGYDNLFSIGGVDPTSGFNISNNQNLVTVSGFNCLESIAFDLLIQDNPSLENIEGLSSLESVGQFFTIRNNASLATLNGLQNLTSVSSAVYATTVVFEIHDNPQLSDCDPLCNLLSSNGIIGLTNITDNLTGCNSEAEINTVSCTPSNVLACTTLAGPINGAVDVAIDTNITWDSVPGATSYLISIGTTSGGTDIANRLNVGNITDYDLPNDLPPNTEIFVKVIPQSGTGNATCCEEESFTTGTTPLECTALNIPLNNDTDVLIAIDLSWNAVANATGYTISIGTTSGGNDITNNLDVGNIVTYNPPTDFPYNTQIFVTIIPYTLTEQASGCLEENFVTEEEIVTPEPLSCTSLINPTNGSINVSVNTDISWSAITDATGYLLSIGTNPGTNDIINNEDVGTITNFSLPTDLPASTEIFVRVIPYNPIGQAVMCLEESFSTETKAFRIPNFFTPNNDGYNDVWTVIGSLNEIDVVYIYDRYGKLLKTLDSINNEWNGVLNGELLPVSDYWYVIELFSGKKIEGHFALKR